MSTLVGHGDSPATRLYDFAAGLWPLVLILLLVETPRQARNVLVGMCATDGAVFAANNADGTVVQIDPQDGRVVGLIPVGHAPTDVASWDGTVWVSIQSESAI